MSDNIMYECVNGLTVVLQGEKLTSLAGPGLKGLVNIGSSCYMNAVLQAFFAIPEVQTKYFSSLWAQELINRYMSNDPPSLDLSVQLVKLGNALLSDRYTLPVRTEGGEGEGGEEEMPQLKLQVAPRMLKYIVGKGMCVCVCVWILFALCYLTPMLV
jgi:ubiquitin carboxyl-terminal hydrolase 5/13